MDKNIYYKPEAFGLKIFDEIDQSSGSYEYDTLVVFENGNGELFFASDSGCSCPSPFEGEDLSTITKIESFEEFERFVKKEWVKDDREYLKLSDLDAFLGNIRNHLTK